MTLWSAGNRLWYPRDQHAKNAAVESANFYQRHRPDSYTILSTSVDGDTALLRVRFESQGNLTLLEHVSIPDAVEYGLYNFRNKWKLVSFRKIADTSDPAGSDPPPVSKAAPKVAAKAQLENYLLFLSELAKKPNRLTPENKSDNYTLESYWVSERNSLQNQSMLESVSVFRNMKPSAWLMARVASENETSAFEIRYTTGKGGFSIEGEKKIRYKLVQEGTSWQIQERIDLAQPAPSR